MTDFRKIAHDSGDGETIYHCPFCGSGQVLARSDGTVECEFCHTAFTVQVQPEMPAFPQTINGVPVDVPGMPGAVGEDASGSSPLDPNGPLPGEEGDEAPGGSPADPAGGSDSGDSGDSGDNPFSKNSFRTATGALLSEREYANHLAIKFASNAEERQAVLDRIRASRES